MVAKSIKEFCLKNIWKGKKNLIRVKLFNFKITEVNIIEELVEVLVWANGN